MDRGQDGAVQATLRTRSVDFDWSASRLLGEELRRNKGAGAERAVRETISCARRCCWRLHIRYCERAGRRLLHKTRTTPIRSVMTSRKRRGAVTGRVGKGAVNSVPSYMVGAPCRRGRRERRDGTAWGRARKKRAFARPCGIHGSRETNSCNSFTPPAPCAPSRCARSSSSCSSAAGCCPRWCAR